MQALAIFLPLSGEHFFSFKIAAKTCRYRIRAWMKNALAFRSRLAIDVKYLHLIC
jgi:hypothetical protein